MLFRLHSALAVLVAGLIAQGDLFAGQHHDLKVVSLSPAITAMIYELGQGDILKGVTRYGFIPDGVKNRPAIVGGAADPEVEKILSLHPDLILTSPLLPEKIEERFHSFGLTVKRFRQDTLEDILNQIQWLGELTGCRPIATREVERARKIMRKAPPKVPAHQRTVILIFSEQFQLAAGAETYGNEILQLAGFENVAASLGQPWPMISHEWLLRKNPYWIVLATHRPDAEAGSYRKQSLKLWKNNKVLAELDAVRQGRVLVIADNRMGIPSLRLFPVLEELRHQLARKEPEALRQP